VYYDLGGTYAICFWQVLRVISSFVEKSFKIQSQSLA